MTSLISFIVLSISALLFAHKRVCGKQRADTNLAIENFNFQSSFLHSEALYAEDTSRIYGALAQILGRIPLLLLYKMSRIPPPCSRHALRTVRRSGKDASAFMPPGNRDPFLLIREKVKIVV